jgi:hybrid cluster-associated redox disulfide protein
MAKTYNMKNKKITKKMTVMEIVEKNPKAMEILMENGMHCCACPMAQQETLEEGCSAHGLNADKIVNEINAEKKKPGRKK